MKLKDYIGRGAEKVGALLSKVRVGGFTIPSILRRNRDNTKSALFDSFKSSVMSDVDVGTYSQSLEKIIKRRKRAALTTLKNTYSAVRGEARAILASGKRGFWANSSVLDGNTTDICMSHIGQTWNLPYSQIPNKPPRIPPTHPCRSILLFREVAVEYPEEVPFMDQFSASPALQRELLGVTRFEAFVAGFLTINSFAEYEKNVLTPIEELDIE